ncbi:MAG: DUF814 domain-containing protein [Acidobacteria bacterium]|nr:DUF814 domain-containing protein [Acidobacteriota bacterium]
MLEDFHLHHLCLGLRQRLTGRRVAGVQTAGATRLLIRWEGNAERCLVQLDPDRPTIRILAARARRDSDTWVNCPAIDDELAGRRLTDLEKVSDDRRVVLRFGDAGAILVAEVRPIAPSLHLCDAGGVVRYALGPLRTQLQPLGAPYREPVRAGRVPPEAGSIRELLAAGDGRDRRRALLGRVQRLSPLLLDEAQARAGVDEPDVLAAAVAMVVAEAYAPSAGAILYARQPWLPDEYRMDPRGDFRLSTCPLRLCRDWSAIRFERFEDAADRWFDYAEAHRRFVARRDAAARALVAKLRKSEDRVAALERELARTDDAETGRRYGELILAHLHRLGAAYRGVSVEVPDVYQPEGPAVRVPLDPEKTLRENADSYFRRWRKARQARENLPEHLRAERERRAALAQQAAAVRAAVCDSELSAAPAQPSSPTARQRPAKGGGAAGARFRRFRTRSGLDVRVGRSAAENDRLTFGASRPDDVWLHAADYAGSHVVLAWGQKTDPPLADLREAAAVAAWYSGARREPAADIRWTRCKYVQKVKGTAGLVRLMKFKTLRVAPALPPGETAGEADT